VLTRRADSGSGGPAAPLDSDNVPISRGGALHEEKYVGPMMTRPRAGCKRDRVVRHHT
jgi:hypothetical protein